MTPTGRTITKTYMAEEDIATMTSESRASVSSTVPTTLAPAPIVAQNASARGGGLVRRAIAAQDSPILNMPPEVQQKIFRFAVTHDESIYPTQIAEKSNKFLWSKVQIVAHAPRCTPNKAPKKMGDDGPSNATPLLTAVALSQTCRQIYDSVALTHMFYEENHFDFIDKSNKAVITFLVALTDERRNRIHHIALSLDTFRWTPLRPELFTVIAAMKGLQTLDLRLDPVPFAFNINNWENLKGYKQLLGAVQGLKEVKVIIYVSLRDNVAYGSPNDIEAATLLKATLEAQMKSNPKREKNFNPGILQNAESSADLHVHGEGRLSDDKKPGIVSSRTRAATRNLEKLDANGVLPKRNIPRYDLNGDLAWYIVGIKDSREVKSDDGSVLSIEFLVSTTPSFWDRAKIDIDWEDMSVLNTGDAQDHIVRFYASKKHTNAVGREDILHIWNLREDVDEPRMWNRILHLKNVVVKQAKQREKQEEREQAKALKAQLRAAKKVAKSPTASKATSSGIGNIAAAPVPTGPFKGSGK